MSVPNALVIQFNAQLIDSIAQLGQFVQLLKQERELLGAENSEALLELAQLKQAAIRRLQEAENARALMLARNAIAADRAGMQAFVASQSATLGANWAHFEALAHEARELNQGNGIYIRDQMRHNQLALAVLLEAGAPSLYDAGGLSPQRPGGSRISDRA